MSTESEKIRAQRDAARQSPVQPWQRHLIGPVELEVLLIALAENQELRMRLAALKAGTEKATQTTL